MQKVSTKMKQLDTSLFRITEQDGLRFVMPKHSAAVSNEAWDHDNLWLRSRIEVMKNGDTVSQGFGKFFNLGMGPDGLRIDTQTILDAVKAGERVVATYKHDGSCLIRSVYDGKVMFRTRGSFQYGYHDGAQNEMGVFLDRYPKINDPTWMADKSLLFEWVTPDFQIVIKYEKLELYLIGGVDHGHRHYSHLRYLTVDELKDIAVDGELVMMDYFTIDSIQDWYIFYHSVINDKEIEGYVLRLNNEQDLVKVKSQPYLIKHGLKSSLSFKNMVEFWLQHGQGVAGTTIGQLEAMYDEEVVMWALPFVIELETAIEKWDAVYNEVNERVSDMKHWGRKDFAIEMQKVYKNDRALFSLAMLLYQDQEAPDRMIRNYMQKFDINKQGTGRED